jgi:hypothetical protein
VFGKKRGRKVACRSPGKVNMVTTKIDLSTNSLG